MNSELQLLLLLAIIIAVSKLASHLSDRYLHQPVVFGEILAGLLLGPTLFNIFGWPVFQAVNPESWRLHDHIEALAEIGVLLLMFIAGLETDLAQMRKVGATALWAAIGGVLLPLAGGIVISRLFGLGALESIFIGAVLTATSVSISAQTLMELGRLNSKEGSTILAAAVIDDVLGIIILYFVVAIAATRGLGGETQASLVGAITRLFGDGSVVLHVVVVLVLMAAFFALVLTQTGRILGRVLVWADRLHASFMVPAAALVLIFLFAVGAEYIGQVAAITGAYIVGVFVAQTRYAKQIAHAIHPFTYALFVPVFFMSIGLNADARTLLHGNLWFTLTIVAVAVLAKILGCGLGARFTGFTTAEASRVGVGMISRGEVGLIVAQVGLASLIITRGQYAVLVIMVLVSTVITPVLLRLTFPRCQPVEAEVYESVAGVETAEEEDTM